MSSPPTATARRPKLLLSAYSCCPNRGSEPGIGWNYALQLSKYCDTWVLTDGTDWPERINAYQQEHGPVPNLHFAYVPRTKWEKSVEYTPYYNHVAYRRWQRRAFTSARMLHEKIHFDLAHQLTFLTYRTPSYLFRLGIPFIWGPIGGAQDYPWRFLPSAGFAAASSEALRTMLNVIELRFSPIVREAARKTAAAIAANSDNQHNLKRVLGLDSTLICDVGIPEISDQSKPIRTQDRPLRILWAGVFEARKALELLLQALSVLPDRINYELTVIGKGPEEARWRALAQKLGLNNRIKWLGQVTHAEAQDQFSRSDLFTFTSLRDTTGTVVVEALGAGSPVICFDHQGVGDVVTQECGIKIPVKNRQAAARDFSAAIIRLHDDPTLLQAMSNACLHRAKEYQWSTLAHRIAEIYNQVLTKSDSEARCDLSLPSEHKETQNSMPGEGNTTRLQEAKR